jgi:hypothetical protein
MWKNRLPQVTDVNCSWGMFSALNYIYILHGLGWFDTEKIKQEYQNFEIDDDSGDVINSLNKNSHFRVSHKEMIKILKNGNYSNE